MKRPEPPSMSERARREMIDRQERETARMLGEKPVTGIWLSEQRKPKAAPKVNAEAARKAMIRKAK